MELILERELEPGDPLPTENELSAALGVGRNTLRESLKVLQALGVIEIRHGFGMFVAPSNFDALTDGLTFRGRLSLRHHGQEALQLVDVRQALESGLIGAAMDEITRGTAGRGRGVRAPDGSAGRGRRALLEADAEFHRRLFEPLNNELLISLLGVFWKVYRRIHLELGGPDAVDLAADGRRCTGRFTRPSPRRTRPWPPSGSTATSTGSAASHRRDHGPDFAP